MLKNPLNIQIKEKPKICTIDLDREIVKALENRGLQCFSGTLGSQVKVPNSVRGSTHQCLLNYNFPPNFHEYDIVIVDLQAQEPIEYVESQPTYSYFKGSEQTVLSCSYPQTIFDPRSFSSNILKKKLEDSIRETIVVIFCSTQEVSEYYPVQITHNGCYLQRALTYYLYNFVPGSLRTNNKTGQNINTLEVNDNLKFFLQKYEKSFIYEIVFEHPE